MQIKILHDDNLFFPVYRRRPLPDWSMVYNIEFDDGLEPVQFSCPKQALEFTKVHLQQVTSVEICDWAQLRLY
jgi:hypothetical protein